MKITRSVFLVSLVFSLANPGRPEAPSQAASPVEKQPSAQPQPLAARTQSSIEPPQLVVDDGQLISHDFAVFVTHLITPEMTPTLRFSGSHFLSKAGALERDAIEPRLIAPHQYRQITVGTTQVPVEGTLLTFDLSGYSLPFYKAAVRLLPALQWNAPPAAGQKQGEEMKMVAIDEVYLGNLKGAILWTVATVVTVGITMLRWSIGKARQVAKFKPRPALLLITGSDGYLSLWRAQLLLWTVAVGSLVFMFGLVRLQVPEIPETLVALMGMSLLTGTVSATKARLDTAAKQANQEPKSPAPAAGGIAPAAPAGGSPPVAAGTPRPVVTASVVKMNLTKAHWGDLISNWNDHIGQLELSIPKAQMVFWTVIILGLFLVKSVLLGALWPVPWPMVALTGMSQAGYIGDKYVQSISAEDKS